MKNMMKLMAGAALLGALTMIPALDTLAQHHGDMSAGMKKEPTGGNDNRKPLPRPTPPVNVGEKGNNAGNPALGASLAIFNVTKDDAGAKPNPKAPGRLVPVKVEYRTKLSPGAKLMELEATLKTTNTDGSMTEVKMAFAGSKNMETIMLPMPEGVFAKEFVLTLNAKCTPPDGKGVIPSRQVKTGTFPILPR